MITNQHNVPPSNPKPKPNVPNVKPKPADTIEDMIQNTERISKCNSILLSFILIILIVYIHK